MPRSTASRTVFATLFLTCSLFFIHQSAFAREADTHGFLRYPDVHGDRVVFTSSGDLWVTLLDGGPAQRITSHEGDERFAAFSPDGQWIAFTGQYAGNDDVYIMPATGGRPVQLTFHSARDWVVGWDDDGCIVFKSRNRTMPHRTWSLFRVDPDGGYPEQLSYLRGSTVTYEPNGPREAMVVYNLDFHTWNRYQGGNAEQIWVGDPETAEYERPFDYPGNQSHPMWGEDGRIYFVCDSTGRENLWSMLPDGDDARLLTSYDTFDIRWPKLHGSTIIYQRGADLAVCDITTGETRTLNITVPSDLPRGRARFVDPGDFLEDWNLSPDGLRLAVSARGEVFTLPVYEPGLIRQWTFSSGSREKDPQFLPDDEGLLVISDANGEEVLSRLEAPGTKPLPAEKPVRIGWKYGFEISPDGNWAAYGDYTQQLFVVNLASGKRTEIAAGEWEFHEYAWAPDSRWLAYTKNLTSDRSAVYVYDTEEGESHLVSDPHFSTDNPAWDREGRFLYCVSERNFDYNQDYNRGLFTFEDMDRLMVIRLRADVASPFIARGDAPKQGKLPDAPWLDGLAEEEEEPDNDQPEPIVIDFNAIADRMEPFPYHAGSFANLASTNNSVYFVEYDNGATLKLFRLASGKAETVAEGVNSYRLSTGGETIVVRKGDAWYYGVPGLAPLALDSDHQVSTDGWQIEVTPREEWEQILHEAWRLQRDFFYEEGYHGGDWDEVIARARPLLDRVTTRDDLRDLLSEVLAELHAGHAYIWGGDDPEIDDAPIGLLGVDLEPDPKSGLYRITRVLAPEPGTKHGASPLHYADPQAAAGTYLLAINDIPVNADNNLNRLLRNKAGQVVELTLNEKPDIDGSRKVTIRCLSSEYDLRMYDWIKRQREYVWRESRGMLGYVFLPDMAGNGVEKWGRDYYAQRRSPGLIIDDRFNGGGNVSEYFIKELTTPMFAVQSSRHSGIETKPHGVYHGHVAVLINGKTASDGETFAYATKELGIGTLIGERTWGGWIWIWGRWPSVDRGGITVPEFGGWGMHGDWIIEGPGVAPEVEVINDPGSEMRGEDKQLDYAIELLLRQIEDDPMPLPERPEKGPIRR